MTLFLGCTDALTADFISQRTGEASIAVTSKAKQLGTWRISNYTPEYRETSGVGRRRLMTMDEVLRMDVDKALVIIRGKNVLEVDKYDYSKHPEAKKLRPSKASSHIPAWRAENKGSAKPVPGATPPGDPSQDSAPQQEKAAPRRRTSKKKSTGKPAEAIPAVDGTPAEAPQAEEPESIPEQCAPETPEGTTRVVTTTKDSILSKSKKEE